MRSWMESSEGIWISMQKERMALTSFAESRANFNPVMYRKESRFCCYYRPEEMDIRCSKSIIISGHLYPCLFTQNIIQSTLGFDSP